MSVINRIKEVIDAKSMNLKEFSEATSTNYRTLQNYLSGERKVSSDFLQSLTEHMGISASWLLTGAGTMYLSKTNERVQKDDATSPDFVQIQRYAVSASAGHGAINEDEELGTGWYAFNKKWLERRSLKPNNLSVISVRGDSMEPKFSDKDLVLLDHAQNFPMDGFIYTIRVGNELYVKSIQKKGEDTIYMVSANPEYPPLKIDLGDEAQIIGRVVASMHEW